MKKLLITILAATSAVIFLYLFQTYFLEKEVGKSLIMIDETTHTNQIIESGSNELGAWSYGFYTDEFGDLTDNGYTTLTGYGSFSNSATSNSHLRVEMFMDGGIHTPSFKFYEYDSSNPLRGYHDLHLFKCRIKDSQDHIFSLNLYLYRGSDGLTVKFYEHQIEHIEALQELINNEDSAKFSCNEEDQSAEYRFKLDFKYKDNAKRKLQDEEWMIEKRRMEEKEKRREEYRMKRRKEEENKL